MFSFISWVETLRSLNYSSLAVHLSLGCNAPGFFDCQVDYQLHVLNEGHREHVLPVSQVLLVSQEQAVHLGKNIFLYHSVGEQEVEVLRLALTVKLS